MTTTPRRGSEAPMDFEMAAALVPDSRNPWLLAVAALARSDPPSPAHPAQPLWTPARFPAPKPAPLFPRHQPPQYTDKDTDASVTQTLVKDKPKVAAGPIVFPPIDAADGRLKSKLTLTPRPRKRKKTDPSHATAASRWSRPGRSASNSDTDNDSDADHAQFGRKSISDSDSDDIELFDDAYDSDSPHLHASSSHRNAHRRSSRRSRRFFGLPFSNPFSITSNNIVYLPYLITGYVQMLFTLFLFGTVVYMVVQFVFSVRHDLQLKADEYSLEISHQIAECAKSYYANRCSPNERVPAMGKLCRDWELCMGRDPKEVGRLKVGAETLAEILNKLIEPLSYKTMIFGTLTLLGTLFLANSAVQFAKAHSVGDSMRSRFGGDTGAGAGARSTATTAAAAAAAAVAATRRSWFVGNNAGMRDRRRVRTPRPAVASARTSGVVMRKPETE